MICLRNYPTLIGAGIGAGIGGVAGNFAGDRRMERYYAQLAEMNAAVEQDLAGRFGDTRLSGREANLHARGVLSADYAHALSAYMRIAGSQDLDAASIVAVAQNAYGIMQGARVDAREMFVAREKELAEMHRQASTRDEFYAVDRLKGENREWLRGEMEWYENAREKISEFMYGAVEEAYGISRDQFSGAIQDGLLSGITLLEWTADDVGKFLGMSNLEATAKESLARMMQSLGQSLPTWYVLPEGVAPRSEMERIAYEQASPGVSHNRTNARQNTGFRLVASVGETYQFDAVGGIFDRPHLGMVAEAGAEAVIPLSSGRRDRGVALWKQAGEMLGMNSGGGFPVVRVENITIAPDVSIESGADEATVAAAIKTGILSATDEIAHRLAIGVERCYANMPTAAEYVPV